MKLLSSAKGRAIDGQIIFEKLTKHGKCERSGLRRIPPLGTGKGAMPVLESESPWLFQADRQGCHRLRAMAPADKKMLRDFVKPTEQRHSHQQHSVAINIAALRRNLMQSGHPHHAVDLV